MIPILRRLFRRTPPHLRGKKPQDAGEGTEPTGANWFASGDRLNRYDSPEQVVGEMQRAMARHYGDKAEIVLHAHRPGYYEIRVCRDGKHVATTLDAPLPTPRHALREAAVPSSEDVERGRCTYRRPTPLENARSNTGEEKTW